MADTMHVLQIVGDPVGGIRHHVHALLFGLSVKGIRQSYAYSISSSDLVFRMELPELERVLDGRLLPLPIPKKPSFCDILNLLRLRRYVVENRVTIVHGHGAKGGAYARMLALLCDVKAIYTPHGGAVHDMFGKLEGGIYTLAEKSFIPLTNKFVFESQYSAKAYFNKVGRQPRNWVVNYNGIAVPSSEGDSRRFPGTGMTINIGVFGMLRAQKGQIYAVRAMAELVRSHKNILLHVYGDGPDRALLGREAETLGIADKILFHGETGTPLDQMKAMDIILIPSLFESFGYVAIEAFFLKRPVVASNVGGLPEIISDGTDGLLVPPALPSMISSAILKLIEDPQFAEKLGGTGSKKLTSRFSISGMLENLAAIYDKAGQQQE